MTWETVSPRERHQLSPLLATDCVSATYIFMSSCVFALFVYMTYTMQLRLQHYCCFAILIWVSADAYTIQNNVGYSPPPPVAFCVRY